MYTLRFVAVVCGQLTKSPENVAALVGSNVTLRCAGTTLSWEESVSDASGNVVSISMVADVFHRDKYDLTTEPTGTYDLTIKSIQLNQGGQYRCKGIVATKSYTFVQVITFSGEILLLFLP